MSVSTITFFPVDNGSMTLLKLNDSEETIILIDINIREKADSNGENEFYDVGEYLRKQLKKDNEGRPYVDVFLLTHNDDDHVRGLQKHFHLGSPDEYKKTESDEEPEKILIHEMWSSYRFWKRATDSNSLSDDAKAFNKEIKRRVKLFKENQKAQKEGNRVIIIGKDPDGKTDNLIQIVRDIDATFSVVNGKDLKSKLKIYVLGPLPQQENEEDEEFNRKNRGSVIVQVEVIENGYSNKIILPGDAEVFVWETLWKKFKNNTDKIEYDILLTPHHCSWHSLSYDSASKSDNPQVCIDAKEALSQAKEGAYIVSSSKPIKNDDNDPPSYRAKQEYLTIVNEEHFLCTQEYPKENEVEPIVIKLTSNGPQLKSPKSKSKLSKAAIASTGEAFPHG